MKIALKNRQVLVLGLGDTGLSALRWLNSQGALLSVADTRESPPGVDTLKNELPHVVIYTGAFKREVFEQAALIVASPGVSLQEAEIQAAIARNTPVVGDVELFAQYRPQTAKVIAITGSNGKTTVTTLVGEMCKAAGLNTLVAGNIGLPVLDTLSMMPADVYVLELSSFQLETTHNLMVNAGVVLNVTEDHMDRYDGMADYAKAKARIFAHANQVIVNREDITTVGMAHQNTLSFGLNEASGKNFGLIQDVTGTWLAQGKNKLMQSCEMKLTGLHNVANALAALALCRAINVSFPPLLQTLKLFKGLAHRVALVTNVNNIDFYDDSKGTNVGATCAAIAGMTKAAMPQKVVLIAGGDGKGQDFSPLLSPVQKNARAVVLIGRDAHLIEQALLASHVPIYHAVDLNEAVTIAYKMAKANDAVLLSPACASFDMFKNYVHRAEVFIDAVTQLAAQNQQIKADS